MNEKKVKRLLNASRSSPSVRNS